MKITLLWSWDTLWTPVSGCVEEACIDNNRQSKRYRFWLLIEIEWMKILIDTNPDLKWQCIENKFELKDIVYIFITHSHSDHINWMWEFFYRRNIPTKVYYLDNSIIEKSINYFEYLESESILKFYKFNNFQDIKIWNLVITPIELNHGFPCSWFIIKYKNEKIGIISDTSINISKKSKNLLKNSTLLFIDCFSEDLEQVKKLYKDCNIINYNLEKDWYHMTVTEAKTLCNELKIKKAISIHMSRYMSKHNILVEKYQRENFVIWYDGLSIVI
jgi:phosphoribosyl 1,2-cyclic phosphate phosphodiesterase